MSFRNTLIGGFAQPFNGLFIIFFYTITLVITNTKETLCFRKSLIGGFAIPYNGFREVFFYTIAVEITPPK